MEGRNLGRIELPKISIANSCWVILEEYQGGVFIEERMVSLQLTKTMHVPKKYTIIKKDLSYKK